MKFDNILLGLGILRGYYDDPNGYHTGAEHGQIYAYATDKEMGLMDVRRMFELGWFQPEEPGNNEKVPPKYNPQNRWSAFT